MSLNKILNSWHLQLCSIADSYLLVACGGGSRKPITQQGSIKYYVYFLFKSKTIFFLLKCSKSLRQLVFWDNKTWTIVAFELQNLIKLKRCRARNSSRINRSSLLVHMHKVPSTWDIKGQGHGQSKWWISPIDVSLLMEGIFTGLNTMTWNVLGITVRAVLFDYCSGLRSLWHKKRGEYRCLSHTVKPRCIVKVMFISKALVVMGRSQSVTLSSNWRGFISGALNFALEYPSSQG